MIITRSRWWRLKRLCAAYPPSSQQPTEFISYKLHENGDIAFSNSHMTSCWSLDQRVMFGSLYYQVSPSLLWCWYIFCRWRYVFHLSRDPTRPLRWDVMRLYVWELLTVCRTLRAPRTLKSLVTIGILIVKRKNASSKT